MDIRKRVLVLQWAQMRHDELYHKDIVLLSVANRMKHMTLHFAKYVGNVADALDQRDHERLHRALVDAFIISLSSANALNVDLGKELGTELVGSNLSIKEVGLELAKVGGQRTADDTGFHRRFAHHTGRLAKASESLDHLEAYPFRESMKEQVVALFKLLLAEAAIRHLDLNEQSRNRLRGVEVRSIFDELYRAGEHTNGFLER
jgi:hypothetical protein